MDNLINVHHSKMFLRDTTHIWSNSGHVRTMSGHVRTKSPDMSGHNPKLLEKQHPKGIHIIMINIKSNNYYFKCVRSHMEAI